MAFSLNFLARIEIAQNQFDQTYNPATGSTGAATGGWTYNASALGANDNTAATQAADYFLGAKGYLKAGDFIYVLSNDPGYHFLNVAVNNGVTVTTAQIV